MPDGTIDPGIANEMQPGGRPASPRTGAPRVPLSLTIGPETVETWAHLAEKDRRFTGGLARVRAAARRSTTELLPTPYVPVDIPALEAAGFGDSPAGSRREGRPQLHDVLGAAVDGPQTSFVDPVDDAAVDRLRTKWP